MIETIAAGRHDFAFQTGDWRVAHRKLTRRLVGETEWWSFEGECRASELLGGAGNVDDHWIPDPTGAYRAATLRVLDPATGTWSLYWADQRFPGLAAPLHGRFADGQGVFFGDDTVEGRLVRVRFIWSAVASASPRWEQAFSIDGEQNWETNWIMDFMRTA